MTSRGIGQFEVAVLVCVAALEDEAYGAAVRRAVSERLGRDCTVGAVYTTLQRLEDKSFVKSRTSDPTPVRGGRARRYFSVTAAGRQVLREAEVVASRLWSGRAPRLRSV